MQRILGGASGKVFNTKVFYAGVHQALPLPDMTFIKWTPTGEKEKNQEKDPPLGIEPTTLRPRRQAPDALPTKLTR